jgi:peptidoglycan hydrolase-like protein with peptidoglycan-binding domain
MNAMAPRKRTSPKKTPQRKALGLFSAAASATGRFILSHPRSVLGASTFLVVFSIISANALWYQPGHHPSPMFRTRDEANPYSVIGYRSGERIAPEGNVTTFSFQKPDAVPAAINPSLAADRQRITDIQLELTKRGLFNGPADGVPSQDLSAAILAFEEGAGMEPSGAASDELLVALVVDSTSIVAAIPRERPNDDAVAQSGIDPVAAAIRSTVAPTPAPVPAQVAPSAAVASPAPRPRDNAPIAVNTAGNTLGGELPKEVVEQIQQGLINSSYIDVTVDGVAGPKTREAIRSFEKHYRLPETGTPNQLVLNKLKSIGAFNRPAL